MAFECSLCGICCTKVGQALENIDKQDPYSKKELKKFPYKAKEGGSCEMFEDNKCKVYETRPTICNVEAMYDKYYSDKMDKNSYFKQQNKFCNLLQEVNNIPKEFRIKI